MRRIVLVAELRALLRWQPVTRIYHGEWQTQPADGPTENKRALVLIQVDAN